VLKFDANGVSLGSTTVSVAPFARFDLEAGHQNPGPNAVGLIEIEPLTSNTNYKAFLIRYGEKGSGVNSDFAFAFPLTARTFESSPLFLPISTTGNAQNWLELVNIKPSPISVLVNIYEENGSLINASSFQLSSRAQAHININEIIPSSSVGHVKVSTSPANSLIAQSMFYFYSNTGRIASMYGSEGKTLGFETQTGSYNLYLNMANYLKISNISTINQIINIRIQNHDGFRNISLTVISKSSLDLPLHHSSFGTSSNTYGLVKIEGQGLLTEILRVKTNSHGEFDFIFPTSLR
jgi:hypothetical protein